MQNIGFYGKKRRGGGMENRQDVGLGDGQVDGVIEEEGVFVSNLGI